MKPVITVMALLAFAGCALSKKSMNLQEYSSWSNTVAYPYVSSAEASGIVYSLKVFTTDLDLARAISTNEIEIAEAGNFRESYKKTTTAVLKIVLPDASATIYDYPSQNTLNATGRAQYFAFRMAAAFKGIDRNGDTLDCIYAAVERGNSSYHTATANLEFPVNFRELRSVIFNDQILSGSTIIFNFETTGQKPLPKLKL